MSTNEGEITMTDEQRRAAHNARVRAELDDDAIFDRMTPAELAAIEEGAMHDTKLRRAVKDAAQRLIDISAEDVATEALRSLDPEMFPFSDVQQAAAHWLRRTYGA